MIDEFDCSLLRQRPAKFRAVSRHHLPKHLDFLELKLSAPNDWSEILFYYDVMG